MTIRFVHEGSKQGFNGFVIDLGLLLTSHYESKGVAWEAWLSGCIVVFGSSCVRE